MGDYHFIYKDLDGASTQWDDIQTKHGNLPPKPPAFKPPSFTPASDPDSIPKDKSWIDSKAHDELEDLEDDLDDDRFLQEYRYSLFFYCFSYKKTDFGFPISQFFMWVVFVFAGMMKN